MCRVTWAPHQVMGHGMGHQRVENESVIASICLNLPQNMYKLGEIICSTTGII